jgi:hypothetical protein
LSLIYFTIQARNGFLEDNKSGPDNQIKELGQTELPNHVTKGILNKHDGGGNYEIHEDSLDRGWIDAGLRSRLAPNSRARPGTGTRRQCTPGELVVSGRR